MTWRSIPWKVKEKTMHHETRDEAVARAQKVANKTGDWVLVDGGPGDRTYIQPNTAPRRR